MQQKNFWNRKNYYNNRVDSPTFLLPQINSKSINASNWNKYSSSRFNKEDIFYNKKSKGRSKSSIIKWKKNCNNINKNNNIFTRYNNVNNGNNYNFSCFSNFGRQNEELSNINKLIDNNIINIQNNYDNKKNENNYISFNKRSSKSINNSAFSSVAQNEIVHNNQFLYNKCMVGSF